MYCFQSDAFMFYTISIHYTYIAKWMSEWVSEQSIRQWFTFCNKRMLFYAFLCIILWYFTALHSTYFYFTWMGKQSSMCKVWTAEKYIDIIWYYLYVNNNAWKMRWSLSHLIDCFDHYRLYILKEMFDWWFEKWSLKMLVIKIKFCL